MNEMVINLLFSKICFQLLNIRFHSHSFESISPIFLGIVEIIYKHCTKRPDD